MGVVFAVLVLLLFSIYGLGLVNRLITRRETARAAAIEARNAETALPEATTGERGVGGEIVAVIAAALALAEADAAGSAVGTPPRPSTGMAADAWALAGRQRQMAARGRPAR